MFIVLLRFLTVNLFLTVIPLILLLHLRLILSLVLKASTNTAVLVFKNENVISYEARDKRIMSSLPAKKPLRSVNKLSCMNFINMCMVSLYLMGISSASFVSKCKE